jgi:hypothetical protein
MKPIRALLLALALLVAATRTSPANLYPLEAYSGVDLSAVLGGYTDEQVIAFGLQRLHTHCHPDGPVGVVREELRDEGVWAKTERCGPGYLIHLGTEAHGEFLLVVLAHEWAHCLAFPDMDCPQDSADCGGHGWRWGVQFSRSYRAIWYGVDTPNPDLHESQPAPSAPDAAPSTAHVRQ